MEIDTMQYGRVSRLLPQLAPDTAETAKMRVDADGSQFVQTLVPDFDVLNQEQSYYMFANAQGSPISGPVSAAYSATAAGFLIIKNKLAAGSNKRIHLDFIKWNVTTAPASGTNANYYMIIDAVDRLGSGGTDCVPFQPNWDAISTSIARVTLGVPTISAAGATIRPIDTGLYRSVIPAIGDQVIFNFGSVEKVQNPSLIGAATGFFNIAVPPVILGGGQCLVLYLWFASNAVTGQAANWCIGWFER